MKPKMNISLLLSVSSAVRC